MVAGAIQSRRAGPGAQNARLAVGFTTGAGMALNPGNTVAAIAASSVARDRFLSDAFVKAIAGEGEDIIQMLMGRLTRQSVKEVPRKERDRDTDIVNEYLRGVR